MRYAGACARAQKGRQAGRHRQAEAGRRAAPGRAGGRGGRNTPHPAAHPADGVVVGGALAAGGGWRGRRRVTRGGRRGRRGAQRAAPAPSRPRREPPRGQHARAGAPLPRRVRGRAHGHACQQPPPTSHRRPDNARPGALHTTKHLELFPEDSMRFTELYWKFAQLGGFFVALVGVLAAVRSLKLLRRCGRRAGCRGETAGGHEAPRRVPRAPAFDRPPGLLARPRCCESSVLTLCAMPPKDVRPERVHRPKK